VIAAERATTRRLVLEAWDRLGLAPRNRDGRYEAGEPAEPSARRHSPARGDGDGQSAVPICSVSASPRSTAPVAEVPAANAVVVQPPARAAVISPDRPAAQPMVQPPPTDSPAGERAFRQDVLRRCLALLAEHWPLSGKEPASGQG
jgi:hypothetical protein